MGSKGLGKIVIEYINKFPKASKISLARKLNSDYPLLFTSVESARSSVRAYYNKNGMLKRSKIHIQKDNTMNEFSMPESYKKKWKPFVLPKANNNVLFLTDLHFPYQDNKAIKLSLKAGKKLGVNTIWLNGDCLDCYQASAHEKRPDMPSLRMEFDIFVEFIQMLKKEFPECKIYMKEGNHEKRWRRMLMRHAPMIFGCDEFRLDVILKLGELGVEWIPNEQLVHFGKLNVIHGNEMSGGGGVMASRTMYLKAGESVIAGDKHKTNEYTKVTINGKMVGTFSVGCLCDMHPEYLPMGNDWNLGFAHIVIDKDGGFSVVNYRIDEQTYKLHPKV